MFDERDFRQTDGTGSADPDNERESSNHNEHREALLKSGYWIETMALVELANTAAGEPKATRGANGSAGAGKAKATRIASGGADAARKAKEREKLLKEGWRQHNVLAPDNPLAREFLSAAAEKLKSRKILRALRAAMEDPDLVVIGRKVRRLRGEAGDQVRRLLGL